MTGIQCLTNLMSVEPALDIYGNNDISNTLDLSPLAGLTNLNDLDLDYNHRIDDITPLAGLTDLTNLYLSNNSISDISALVSNSGVDNGDFVNIRDNPLDCEDAATQGDISTLEARGVELYHACSDVDTDAKERRIRTPKDPHPG